MTRAVLFVDGCLAVCMVLCCLFMIDYFLLCYINLFFWVVSLFFSMPTGEIRRALRRSGIPVETTKGETGIGQHEINIR